jgi:hypothetical protein
MSLHVFGFLLVFFLILGLALLWLCWLLRISVPKSGRKQSCRKPYHHLSDA